MDDALVDKVARAIAHRFGSTSYKNYKQEAIAAIQAMIDAGWVSQGELMERLGDEAESVRIHMREMGL